MSNASSTMATYKAMNEADKEALKELQGAEIIRTGAQVKLVDIIHATTPGFPDPAYLSGPMRAEPLAVEAA